MVFVVVVFLSDVLIGVLLLDCVGMFLKLLIIFDRLRDGILFVLLLVLFWFMFFKKLFSVVLLGSLFDFNGLKFVL